MNGYFLPISALNEPMRTTIDKLIAHAKRARWTNAIVRKDAVETGYEADWIKSLVRVQSEAEVLRLNGGGGEAVATQWLAEMIMSDCGCSTDNQRLLERIIARIEQYERANSAPQPQQAAPETIVFNNPSYEPWLREQEAHMQVTGPLHVVCRCDSCKASQQAAPGAVLEGWQLVPVEPTWDMKIAASTAYREARDGHYTARMEQASDCWSAMLLSAPKPQGE